MDTNPSMNQQNHPHSEGQQNNIAPQGGGQPASSNNSHELSDMGNRSQEQTAGRDQQAGEQNVQQEERQP